MKEVFLSRSSRYLRTSKFLPLLSSLRINDDILLVQFAEYDRANEHDHDKGNGEPVRVSDALVRGRVALLSFLFRYRGSDGGLHGETDGDTDLKSLNDINIRRKLLRGDEREYGRTAL